MVSNLIERSHKRERRGRKEKEDTMLFRSVQCVIVSWGLWHVDTLGEVHPHRLHFRKAVESSDTKTKAAPPRASPTPPPTKIATTKICTPLDEYHFEPAIVLTLQGRPGKLTAFDMETLQRSFLQAYNMLSLPCGGAISPITTGAFLRLQQVEITNHVQGVSTTSPAPSVSSSTTQQFTLFATIEGVCRGCQTPFQLWRETPSRNRKLMLLQEQTRRITSQEAASSKLSLSENQGGAAGVNRDAAPAKKMPLPLECNCLVPFKSSLIQTLNTKVLLPRSVEKVLDLDQFNPITTCPNERNFTSFLTIDFMPGQQNPLNVTNIATQYLQLQQAVVNAYNDANNVLNTGNVCDPTFTVVTSALVVVSPSSGYGPTGLNRRLTSSKPDSSYTFQMSGRCRGCSDSTAMYNDASGRRRLQHLNVGQHYQGGAPFQDDRWTEYSRFDRRPTRSLRFSRQLPIIAGDCFCPVTATQFRRPTATEYLQALNDQLQVFHATGALTIVGAAQTTLQVNPVNCSAQVSLFKTEVTIDVSGNASSLTSAQLTTLGQAFQDTYNALALQTCDPLFRTIESVQVLGIEPSGNRRDLSQDLDFEHRQDMSSLQDLSTLLLLVNCRCRDCPQSTALFNGAVAQGRLLRSVMISPERSVKLGNTGAAGSKAQRPRLLQQVTNQTDQCYCNIAANNTGAPTLGVFTVAFNQTVVSSNAAPAVAVTTVNQASNVTFPPSEAPILQTKQSNAPLPPTILPAPAHPTATPPSIVSPVAPSIVSPLTPVVTPVVPAILPVATPVVPVLVPVVTPVVSVLDPVVTPVVPVVAPAVEPVVPVVAPAVEPVLPVVAPVITPAVPVATPALPVVVPVVAPAVEPTVPVLAPAVTPAVAPIVGPVLPVVVAPAVVVPSAAPNEAPVLPATTPTLLPAI